MNTLLLIIRLLFVAQLVYVAVDFSLRTLLSFCAVLVVFYLLQDKSSAGSSKTPASHAESPSDDEEKDVPADVATLYRRRIAEFSIGHDPTSSPALQHFLPVKNGTECIFAKTAHLWAAAEWNEKLSLEENVERSIPALIKCLAIGPHCQLDGFLFELPGDQFGSSPEVFGGGVRRLLTCLSEADPTGVRCMRRSYIGGRGWFFEFAGTSIFVTTFAPCYGVQHSRHAFGADGCFVLLQPEYSFAAKNLPADTPVTNWDSPQTVRDRIRVAYRQAGREYLIRDSVFYSPAVDIVKPLPGNTDDVIEWWKTE